jgi:ssDNA-binding Zn-finger/Zn-ribbon topoisomerase 1
MKIKTNGALTSGQVAKLCGVAPRTVSNWMEKGILRGWRIPGSQDRRFLPEVVARFIQDNGMPMPDELRPFAPKAAETTQECPKCGGYLSRVGSEFHCVAKACGWSIAMPAQTVEA